ncbi:MAG: hypothetical protein M1834_007667 [Cirrosporium novae-zelandiae]|nr:MAG: hypothetical protein M1834_007667 [Cirrosporium novae-zelandiae]
MYTAEVFGGARELRKYHPLLRPVIQYFVPALRTLKYREAKAYELVASIAAARNDGLSLHGWEKEVGREKEGRNRGKVGDMLDWFRHNILASDLENRERQVKFQLALSMVSIHTTSMSATHAIFDLAARPEYLDPLRKEVLGFIKDKGGGGGGAAREGMDRRRLRMPRNSGPLHLSGMMPRLDSFMKESLRCNPPGMVQFARKIYKPFTLSDGTFISAGTRLGVAANTINKDPSVYGPNADKFDGFRFYDMRKKEENEEGGDTKSLFTSTSPTTSLTFGYGKHACPGRFFAANEIKILLVVFLRDYEVRMPLQDGKDGSGGSGGGGGDGGGGDDDDDGGPTRDEDGRWENIVDGMSILCNFGGEVEVRRRGGG